ncbi:MAG TPA: glutathione S-transferase C-terminal domain-containing protein [Steroidobacteraceae bacterium]|nr:glutathione S-transferase C-terminal domain-containing protein [Steroidobacteraceae bacterium]
MIDVYGMSSPNVSKVTIMLEECELPYRTHHVNVIAGQQFEPSFSRISPNNKVPVLVDAAGPENDPFTVFESGAILLYLAGKSGQLLPAAARERSLVEQWLMLQVASLGPMFGQYVHFLRHAPQGCEYARERYASEAKRIFKVLETRLEEAVFLGGEDYSIADIATFPWIRAALTIFPWLSQAEAPLSAYPAVRAWFDGIDARPAVQRGIAAGERFLSEDVTAFKGADAAALDRFFGRGRFAHR